MTSIETIPVSPQRAAPPAGGRRYRPLLVVVVVALLTRCWAAGSLPLLITPDGVWYLRWGVQLAEVGGFESIPAIRTPGYPLFLAGLFTLFSVNPVVVLLAQHLLSIISAGVLTWTAGRVTRPVLGLVPGLLFVLDPWLFAIESYALSETLCAFLVILAASVVLLGRRPFALWGLTLGLLLGAMCLVRPACQVLVPFFVLAWALRCSGTWRRLLTGLLLVVIGFGGPTVPWLLHKRQRGQTGIASGYAVMQFRGLAKFGLLDYDFRPPAELDPRGLCAAPEVQKLLEEMQGDYPTWRQVDALMTALGGAHRDGSWQIDGDLLAGWNGASLSRRRAGFLKHMAYTACWQLNWFPSFAPNPHRNWINWSIQRLAQDGNNVHVRGGAQRWSIEIFEMHSRGGPLRTVLAWIYEYMPGGVPQVPIFLLAGVATLTALVRRNWPLGLLFGGTIAYFAAHVPTLVPVARYAMPVWPVWQLAVIVAPVLLIGRIAGQRGPQPADDARTDMLGKPGDTDTAGGPPMH